MENKKREEELQSAFKISWTRIEKCSHINSSHSTHKYSERFANATELLSAAFHRCKCTMQIIIRIHIILYWNECISFQKMSSKISRWQNRKWIKMRPTTRCRTNANKSKKKQLYVHTANKHHIFDRFFSIKFLADVQCHE